MSKKFENAIAVIGIDIGKNLFHVVGHDERGAIVLRQKWSRNQVEALSNEIEAIAHQDAGCERLMSMPGIGPIISSAMVAAIGAGDVFSKGRDFAAWLELVPKQISTGDRTILGKISRRGNRYLRVLFVQAAWVACEGEAHQVGLWAQTMDRGGQDAAPSQRAGDRAGQQARAYRVERTRARSSLRSERASGRVIICERKVNYYPPRSARG